MLELFQESGAGEARHLDVRIWFRDLRVVHRDGAEVPLAEFVDGGTRWWDGVYRGDPRCAGTGIVPG